MQNDSGFMKLAIEAARRADPFPNPRVGAVLVKGGKVVASAHHEFAGGPHAEILALRKAGKRARGATLYITLEPCSHHAKTPACTAAILRSGISKVVVGSGDPNPSVDGSSVLRRAGVEVQRGVLSKQCNSLNSRIFSNFRHRVPLVAVRYAMSIDGKITTRTGNSKWIGGPRERAHARKLRGSYDVLMVGSGTVLADNPLLTCRTKGMPEPQRVICDSRLRVHPHLRVFSVQRDNVLVITSSKRNKRRERELKAAGIDVYIGGKTKVDLKPLMRALFTVGKRSVLIEGGGTLIGSAFDEKLVDRVYAYISPKIIGGERAISPVRGKGIARVRNALKLSNLKVTCLGPDLLLQGDALR